MLGCGQILRYLNKSYLGGRLNRQRLKLYLLEKQQSLLSARRGGCLVFCSLHNDLIFCPDKILKCFCFVSLFHGLRVTLSDVDVL